MCLEFTTVSYSLYVFRFCMSQTQQSKTSCTFALRVVVNKNKIFFVDYIFIIKGIVFKKYSNIVKAFTESSLIKFK